MMSTLPFVSILSARALIGGAPIPAAINTTLSSALLDSVNTPYGPSRITFVPTFMFCHSAVSSPRLPIVNLNLSAVGFAERLNGWALHQNVPVINLTMKN